MGMARIKCLHMIPFFFFPRVSDKNGLPGTATPLREETTAEINCAIVHENDTAQRTYKAKKWSRQYQQQKKKKTTTWAYYSSYLARFSLETHLTKTLMQ